MLNQTSRRDLLRSALPALAAAPALGAPAAKTKRKPAKAKGVTIGFVTNEFRDFSNAALAKAFAGQKIKLIQLFLTQTDSKYWSYNNRSELKGLTPERCREIAGIYRSAGITIHSIGVYANLIHPDAAERKAHLAYFEAMMKVGEAMGVRKFITEAGHYFDPQAKAERIPHDWKEEVWHTMIATGKELARVADAHDATVLYEPYFQGFLSTAKRTRIFIEEIGSPRMRVNLDPANLIEVNDLDEMFNQLQPLIDCVHAKDRKLHVTKGVPAGGGDVDYVKLVKMALERTPGVPLVLEYADSKSWLQALAYLRNSMRQAGVAEI
jgi:sugar phosphate isomerase/epimerase